jgi:hypothetical protein
LRASMINFGWRGSGAWLVNQLTTLRLWPAG